MMTYPFISHGGGEDEKIVREILAIWSDLAIQSGLRGNDTKPFVAPFSINVGDEWAEEILEAIRQCGWLLAVVTKRFNRSHYPQQEVGIAIGMGKRIFPILGEGMTAEKLPGFLKSKQAISFMDKGKVVQMLGDIVKEINDGLSAVDSQLIKRRIRRRRIIRPGNAARPIRRPKKSSAS